MVGGAETSPSACFFADDFIAVNIMAQNLTDQGMSPF